VARSDSASEMANAENLSKGMDLAGDVVGKEIRSGVFADQLPAIPMRRGLTGCGKDTTAETSRPTAVEGPGVAGKSQGEESVLASLTEVYSSAAISRAQKTSVLPWRRCGLRLSRRKA